jgi:hypothetical protein
MGVITIIGKEKSEPSKTMLKLWDFEHKTILEDIVEIKFLQDYYESL